MRIAVTTPNGNVGHHLTRMLVRSGIRPVLLTRHPEQISPELIPYVDWRARTHRMPTRSWTRLAA